MPTAETRAGADRMPIIDFHAHASTELYKGLIASIGDLGPADRFPYDNFSPPGTPVWTAENALEMMERENIATQVLSLPDAMMVVRGDHARTWARRINEQMAEIVASHPGRFGAFAVIPHDDPDSSLAEIAYALDVLKLDGVCTSTNIRGVYLGDPSFDPWMAELDRRGATLFVHPTRPVTEYLPAPMYLELSFDSTRMVVNMIRTGAKRRFSALNMLVTHAGGTMPFVTHRFTMMEPLIGRYGVTADDITTGLSSFNYDLSSCLGHAVLNTTLKMAPPSRFVMGFDFPYLPALVLGQELGRFFAYEGMTEAERREIAFGNALRLLSPGVAEGARKRLGPIAAAA